MPTLTDYARNMLARALCGRAPALPTIVYAALGTGAGAGGLTGEPAGNGYARQRIVFTGTGAQRNTEALRFVFTGAAGSLTHLGIYDAASGGNALACGLLAQTASVTGPGTVTIAAEALTLNGI
ncbi:hypothetical protein CR162_07695 [Pseudoroseomonas rhizosphaerae]|uniref:Phage tail protein n=1 Tax=Teichococcus rhizosphaerae TaxID=1335062 RepID=A0A2C7AE53_9PROT|nr:hypothetical protein [Pseudoroseomonas rhizosphaerae]PHK95715.1 hypothetical protein CR162_07695 [Pseudoroseomonas rhizosphaerae]